MLKLVGHLGPINQATWNKDGNKILTTSDDKTARVWDGVTGKVLIKIEGVNSATWNLDESLLLTINLNNTVSIWFTSVADLLAIACNWVPRNFTWTEWHTYNELRSNIGDSYRPTCPNAPIPPDAIAGIQEEARQQIRSDQVLSGTQRLEELNGWLQVNGQFKNYGVDVKAFVAEVTATATVEARSLSEIEPKYNANLNCAMIYGIIRAKSLIIAS